MTDVILLLGTAKISVPARALRLNSRLFLDHPGLDTYRVQTAVSRPETFEGFVRAIQDGSDLSVTAENFSELSLLCEEFGADKLRVACADFIRRPIDLSFESFGFREQVDKLASEVVLFRQDREGIRKLEREFEALRAEVQGVKDSVGGEIGQGIGKLEREFAALKAEVQAVKDSAGGEIGQLKSETARIAKSVSDLGTLRAEFDGTKLAFQRLRQDLTRMETRFCLYKPMNEARSLDGIIAHMTKKQGGNVHEKGIITITSKSAPNPANALISVADLTPNSSFRSKDEPGQWVCWDFGEMRVRLTHYTILSPYLKSWVMEGSLDGSSWTEIHRQKDSQNFGKGNIASFAVSNRECRFIRLTQTGKNRYYFSNDVLDLLAVEFFGEVLTE